MLDINALFDMRGQTVLITGGGTGLGRRFAEVLSSVGARVILCARRPEKLEAAADAINADGGDAHWVVMDVADGESVQAGFAKVAGIAPVDVVINNAAIVVEPLLHDLAEEQWDSVMDVNLKGCWLVAREAVRAMIERGEGGVIVNISSVMGYCVQKGTSAYATSKAALIHLTRSMAWEWARYQVRVNALAPGYFRTEMAEEWLETEAGKRLIKRIPQRRLGQHPDLDAAILMLASPASGYMTGSVMTVDGGITLSTI